MVAERRLWGSRHRILIVIEQYHAGEFFSLEGKSKNLIIFEKEILPFLVG
jgi:hypothetical protein